MMTHSPSPWHHRIAAMLGAVMAAAMPAAVIASAPPTSQPDPHGHGSDSPGRTEVERRMPRLVVADAAAPTLSFIDLDGSNTRHDVGLPAIAGLGSALTEDGRFVLVSHDDAVTIVDAGTWSDAHGDHSHHFVAEPNAIGQVTGERPTHLISHGGVSALWFDGLGAATLIDEHELAQGEIVEVGQLDTPGPHHGFAVPYGDVFATTAPAGDDGGMPEQVVIADTAGTAIQTFDCPQTHGEAVWAHGVAAACSTGVLVIEAVDGEWQGELIAYPDVDDTDPYGYGPARAWTLQASSDGEELVATFGTNHLLSVDPHASTSTAIDLGQPAAMFGLAFDGEQLVALTHDGAIQRVDIEEGVAISSEPVVTPFTEGGDEPYRALVSANGRAYVSDPAAEVVVVVRLGETITSTESIELGFAPAFVKLAGV